MKYLFKGFQNIGRGFYIIISSFGRIFNFSYNDDEIIERIRKRHLKTVNESFQEDGDKLRGDWKKVMDDFNKIMPPQADFFNNNEKKS